VRILCLLHVWLLIRRSATPWAGAYAASKAALHSLADALDMELRPLGVRCTLVALGAVRSQLAANGTVPNPPADSLYTAFYPNVLARLTRPQEGQPTPADEAARRIVDASLNRRPPRYMSFAETSTLFWMLSWLPRSLLLWLVWTLQPRPRR
jgi:1-acylglycerone phosphate reductase